MLIVLILSPRNDAVLGLRSLTAMTTSIPSTTLPKTAWHDVRGALQFFVEPSGLSPSRFGVGTYVMKNWLPLV